MVEGRICVGREGFMLPDRAPLLHAAPAATSGDYGAASGGSPLEPGKEGDLGYIRQEFRTSAGFRNSSVEGIPPLITSSCFLRAEYAGLGHYSLCSM